MATITGFIEKIKFRNEDNGYSVLSVSSENEEYVLVGTFHYISEGEMIEATGTMTEHPVYGEQMTVDSYQVKTPKDTAAMERYLGSGAIKGVGAALATRIVRRFKADTFRVIEEEPERLAEVKGISEKMAMAISDQMEEKKDMRQAMIFLQEYGISMNLAAKIYQEYGPRMYGIIKENPYRLADDIPGVGFKMADEIAQKVGIFSDSDYRIKAGILYTLLQASGQGHTYLPKEELLHQAAELLKVREETMDKHLMDMQMDKRLVVKRQPAAWRAGEDENQESDLESAQIVYASSYYYMELNTARMLHDLNIKASTPKEHIKERLDQIQRQENIELDPLQIQAVAEAVNSGLLIITGGPGTGKTTTINTIIRYFEEEEMEILLAAPTGRAAKRMTEATGYEAKTIHRLLELNGVPGEGDTARMRFERNEENPLDADVIIVDEMSMVDIQLMQSLLKAVNVGTRLILVGDVNQLPSVGPGNVLKDMITSGCFNVVRLTHIFRQAAESDIIVNAHRINEGEPVDLGKRSRDFLFIRRDNPDAIISASITLMTEKLPGYISASPLDIQIMTPMRKGALGVERLNTIFQSFLNPPDEKKPEKEHGGIIFRLGDKVMQIKNNYQMEWEVRNQYGVPLDSGVGIFNGDMGVIKELNVFAENLTVEFDDGKLVEYTFKQLEELELAYAITIHKSQGSEYPAVIIPLYSGPHMLMTRNLIYTAVTRARTCVCLVGVPETFLSMAANQMEQKRYSGLKERICEIEQV
ncbi:MAG: ATP-dependent RecD-like DNA helicase [Hungatella sp.]|nr:ATP-dependent RecD-like DNA helicase [Hungatella sp.]